MYDETSYSDSRKDRVGPLTKCHFPSVSKLSAVKSLLAISDSMDVAILQNKVTSTKPTRHFGPWLPDEKWSQRKWHCHRNNRKNADRLLLSKRSHKSEFSRTSSFYMDEKYKTTHFMGSIHDCVDQYFRKRPSTMPGQYLTPLQKSKTPKSNSVVPQNVLRAFHQTPTLPTLITLQSPANKKFHTAFSLGKVEYNNERQLTNSSTDRIPHFLYSNSKSNNERVRQTRSAALKKPETSTSDDKTTAIRSMTSYGIRSCNDNINDNVNQINTIQNDVNHSVGDKTNHDVTGNVNKSITIDNNNVNAPNNEDKNISKTTNNISNNNNNNNAFIIKNDTRNPTLIGSAEDIGNNNCHTNYYKNAKPNSLVAASQNGSGFNFQDSFDQITSPPENPRILKILSQRKPSPPMCEFEDISLHIRHYRMYHTVRFTGRFSLANNPPPQEIKPIQWSEVFPNRPLSVTTTATVPVFRLKVQDFSSQSNNNQGAANEDTPALSSGDKSKLEVPKADEKECEANDGEENTSYRRRSTPNYKDRGATIKLAPTVTPVLKVKVEKGTDEVCFVQEEGQFSSTLKDQKNRTVAGTGYDKEEYQETYNFNESTKSRREEYSSKNKISSKNKTPSTVRRDAVKKSPNLTEGLKVIGGFDENSAEGNTSKTENDLFLKTSTPSGEIGEGDRNTNKVLFSYREFLKRSESNVSRDGLYIPRLRQSREFILHDRQKSREGDWRYRFTRNHSSASLLHPDHEIPIQNWRKIVIDENRLIASIDEKIHDSNLHPNPPQKDPEQTEDKFVKFMIKHDPYRKRNNTKCSDEKNGNFFQIDENKSCSDVSQLENRENDDSKRLGIVSAYDFKNYESNVNKAADVDGRETAPKESSHRPKSSEESASVSSNKKYWCPKLSRLSVKSSQNNDTETMRHLVSSPFQTKSSSNTSAFVIAVPPANKGFDDRSVVLPLHDFVQLAMKGNDKTFSTLSKSINSGCKLGISQNITIRSGSSRRSMDDGLVRVVSFASPVNQFIFAKRITGFSQGNRGVPMTMTSDGSFIDTTEQRGRSVFQGKPSSFRLRLKDVDVHRPDTTANVHENKGWKNLTNEIFINSEAETSVETKKNKTCIDNNDDDCGDVDGDGGFRGGSSFGGGDGKDDKSCESGKSNDGINQKKYFKVYVPTEGIEQLSENDTNVENGPETAQTDSTKTDVSADSIIHQISKVNLPKLTTADNNSPSTIERERSALRKRIVKLAEIRTSSQNSNYETMYASSIYEGHARSSSSINLNATQKAGAQHHSFKLLHNGNPLNITAEHLSDNFKSSLPNISNNHESYATDKHESIACNNLIPHYSKETLPHDNTIASLSSTQPNCYSIRQKAKNKTRKKILKPNAIIHKDINVDTSASENKTKTSELATETDESSNPLQLPGAETKGALVPEGNPMMYTRIIRGSCLKKETDDDFQLPKTVRFKCDGMEYKMVERLNEKK